MSRVEASAQREPVEKTGTLTTIATITSTPPARKTQGMSPPLYPPYSKVVGAASHGESINTFFLVFLSYIFFTFSFDMKSSRFFFFPSSWLKINPVRPLRGYLLPTSCPLQANTPTKLHAAHQSVGPPTVLRLPARPPTPMCHQWFLSCVHGPSPSLRVSCSVLLPAGLTPTVFSPLLPCRRCVTWRESAYLPGLCWGTALLAASTHHPQLQAISSLTSAPSSS